jgi:hypothetical protein
MRQKILWLNAIWDAEPICTPAGVPYAHQIYGFPVAPGSARLNNWVPLQPVLNLSTLDIEPSASTLESVSEVTVNVTLDPAEPNFTVQVNYATANGTALAGTHYTTTSGILTFPPGTITLPITVPLLNFNISETVEFFVNLSAPLNANLGNATATITINPDAGST